MEAKVYRIASELNQTNTQTIVDDLEDAYLTICGMPNRNGGSSTSDTGQAVFSVSLARLSAADHPSR